LTVTVDITDPKVVRAYAHPLRIRILGLLDNRVASPSEIATELDTPLPNTAYHVRQLAALGFIKLVGRKVRGGAVEHRYTATVRPFVSDDVHARLPDIVKRAIAGGWVEQTIEHMVDAVDGGGFARERSHCSRTAGRLDAQAWDEIADLLGDALKQVQRVIEQSEKRVAKDPESEAPTATTVLALFEGPNPAIGDRQPGPKAARRTAAKSPPRKAKRSR
jgi:DNA-binding Lrp family transcriptional regulator